MSFIITNQLQLRSNTCKLQSTIYEDIKRYQILGCCTILSELNFPCSQVNELLSINVCQMFYYNLTNTKNAIYHVFYSGIHWDI